MGRLNRKLAMNRFSPSGGMQYAISRFRRKIIASWNGDIFSSGWRMPRSATNGTMSGTDDQDRAEALHQHAEHEEEHVHHDQELPLVLDPDLDHELEDLRRHVLVDDVVHERVGHREDEDDRPREAHRRLHDADEILLPVEVAIDEELDDDDVEGHDARRLVEPRHAGARGTRRAGPGCRAPT